MFSVNGLNFYLMASLVYFEIKGEIGMEEQYNGTDKITVNNAAVIIMIYPYK